MNSAVGATHFIAARMDGRFQVEAGCFSRHADVNAATADHWGVAPERCYADAATLLKEEKGKLDGIVVLTPTPDHVEPVVGALRAGYAVISEKALASSSADAALIDAAKNAQRGFLAVTYNYSGYPMLRELKRVIAGARLGRIEQIHVEMPQEGFARLNRDGQPMVPQQWRLRDAALPTLSLDLGVHVHHLIDFLTGEKPLEVVAMQSTWGHFKHIVDNSMCIARYTNALECSIWYSKVALGYRNGLRVRVFGEKGSAEWYQMDPEYLILHDASGHKTIVDRASIDVQLAQEARYNRFKSGHPAGFLEAFANLYSDIADALAGFQASADTAGEYVYSSRHALEGLLMLEAMTRSAREHTWQAVDLPA